MQDWPAFIRRHAPAVWRTVYRVLGNESDAADAFQETFIAAVTFDQKQEATNWEAMLRRLASARAIDILRRRVRERRIAGNDPGPEALASPQASPDERSESRELLNQLRALVAELPAQQAELYCLRFVHECSYRQIADELGMTENAVGVALNRIRVWLAQHMIAAAAPEELKYDES